MVTCFIANTEEEGQQCGQQFANDDSIVAVLSGPTFIGTESFYAALAGSKPVIHGVSVSPADTVQETAAVLYGGAKYILAPYATFARDKLGVTSAALVYPEGAGQDEAAAGQASAFEAAGIPIEVVSYPANTPDLTVPLIAAGAQNVDLVMPVINPNDCVKFDRGDPAARHPRREGARQPDLHQRGDVERRARGPPAVALRRRLVAEHRPDRSVRAALHRHPHRAGPGPAHRRSVGAGRLRAGDDGGEVHERLGDDITPDGIVEEMKAFEGPLILGSPVLECGKYPEAPGVCNDYTQFYKYNGAEEVGAGRRLRGTARGVDRIGIFHTPRSPHAPPRG